MSRKVFISAGEASGEYYGALTIEALQRRLMAEGQPQAEFFGMGGPRMVAAGLDRVVRAEDMAVMGVTEVVRHLPRIYREFRKLRQSIRERRPDVAILIDFPDIHFRLARELHALGIPVIFFVSPQLWAWKKHRIELVRKYVDRMVVIFPFEEAFYRERGIRADFVGHPLADAPMPEITREQFAAEYGLDANRTRIGLLPGSRITEIRDHLPEMLKAAHALSALSAVGPHRSQSDAKEDYEFVVPLAPTLNAAQRREVQQLVDRYAGSLAVKTVKDARAALLHARVSIVASGTATVEAALIGNPFVVVYRVSPLTYAVAKRVVDVPHVAMVNLIAGKRVVPELIQSDFTASKIVEHITPLLPDGPLRQSMMQELEGIRKKLRAQQREDAGQSVGAIERLISIVLDQLSPAAASQV